MTPPDSSSPQASIGAAPELSSDDLLRFAREVIEAESTAVARLADGLGDAFVGATRAVMACKKRVVVTGMGKAGLVGAKIAASLASLGTPAFSLHPAEALHGDLGMIVDGDIVLALSNSGESEEIIRLIPYIRDRVEIIAITRDDQSPLGKAATYLLALGRIEEACPLGLAPTASTTAMLALGDALALAVSIGKGFTDQDYAKFHPGGALGRRFQRVQEVMRRDDRLPVVTRDISVIDAVKAMTHARAGLVIVIDDDGKLLGVLSGGDFRRRWSEDPEVGAQLVGEVMTSPCKSVAEIELVSAALRKMHEMRINQLPVVNDEGVVVGMIDIQDLVA